MTTYVYEYPSGGAKFYLQNEYVYPVSGGGQPTYWISGNYWYDYPPGGTPKFYQNDKYIYP